MKKPVIGFYSFFYSPILGGAERSMHNYFSKLSTRYDIYAHCFFNYGFRLDNYWKINRTWEEA